MRAERLSPATRKAIARRAALRRWTEARFGNTSFAALGLPGGEMIDSGLNDLVSGKETIESLVVSLAAPVCDAKASPYRQRSSPTRTGASIDCSSGRVQTSLTLDT